jgi:hypothetical protein
MTRSAIEQRMFATAAGQRTLLRGAAEVNLELVALVVVTCAAHPTQRQGPS